MTFESQLSQKGYVVLPVLNKKDCAAAHSTLLDQMAKSEEIKGTPFPHPKQDKYTLGGFGALAHPSSFHAPIVRDLRRKTYRAFHEHIFESMLKKNSKLKMHAVIDRVMIRAVGDKATTELWHRDLAKETDPGDIVCGGWINLDCNANKDQYFSTFETTHLDTMPANRKGQKVDGFFTLDEEQKKILKRQRTDKKGRKPEGSRHTLVKIPPGHMIVFNEKLIHEVLGVSQDHPVVRLFTGFVVGTGNQALTDKLLQKKAWKSTLTSKELNDVESGPAMPQSLDELIERRCAAPLKSGQLAAFYPSLVFSNEYLFKQLTGYSLTPKQNDKTKTKDENKMARRLQPPLERPPLTHKYTGLVFETVQRNDRPEYVLKCPKGLHCSTRFMTPVRRLKVPGSNGVHIQTRILKRFAGGEEARETPQYDKIDRDILFPHQRLVQKRTRTPPQAKGVKVPIKKHKTDMPLEFGERAVI